METSGRGKIFGIRKSIWVVLCFFSLMVAIAGNVVHAVPNEINYQGYLIDADGVPVNSPTDMTFRLYNVENDVLYEGGPVTVEVVNGVYSIVLGAPPFAEIDPTIFEQDLWLEVTVAGGPEASPRQKLTTVPFAFRAGMADNLAPDSVGPDELLPNTVCRAGDFLNCYTGKEGTRDVGSCRSGTRPCLSDGRGFGSECVGEVLPESEICDGIDNNCNSQIDEGCPGVSCLGPGDCLSGNCVQGICCDSACSGSCESCILPGNLGICTPVPEGQDPASECGAFSCAGYYWGWVGDSCYLRADVSASESMCDGTGQCQDAADLCRSQPKGGVALQCDETCQTPTAGTCTGDIAGACTNIPAGNQSCGQGVCQRTVPLCSDGTPVTCVPGDPGVETCNNVDDDCNGTIDDNISAASDAYEPNDACATPRNIGTLFEESSETGMSATIYPQNDSDYYRFYAKEGSHTCFPGAGQDYRITIRLLPPGGADCQDYRIVLYDDNDSCIQLVGTTTLGCGEKTIEYVWGGTCGADDSRYFRLLVTPVSGAWECVPYILYRDMSIL